MGRDAIRLGRTMKRPSGLGGVQWLAVCLALLMTASTIVYWGHPNAAAQGLEYATELDHGAVVSEHGHRKPCNDVGHTYHQGTCCVSASGCSLCVPVDSQVFMATPEGEPAATAPPFVSSPGDVPIRRRPPKLVVTA